LKKSIIDDLQSDGFHDKDDRVAAISYYTKDWNYEWCLQAGAKRVDLEGREVGTVTQQEEREARERVQSQQRKIREEREATTQQQAPVAVVTASITNKPSARILEDQLAATPLITLPEAKKRGRKVGGKTKEKTGLAKLISDLNKIPTNIDAAMYKRITIAMLEEISMNALSQIEELKSNG
jgi:sRNA-binding protein